MPSIYFGGSRHQKNINYQQVRSVVHMAATLGYSAHVGCQFGADQAVISAGQSFLPVHVFVVAPKASAPAHVLNAVVASVTYSAGGSTAPDHARYLLRSIAAFQGCSQAVFFNPGTGSLAVARECVRSGLSVFAFQQEPPARVPSVSGQWVASSFFGFQCWQWSAPKQISLF